jgi:hypothetical protein
LTTPSLLSRGTQNLRKEAASGMLASR